MLGIDRHLDVELHVLCTRNLTEGWQRLLDELKSRQEDGEAADPAQRHAPPPGVFALNMGLNVNHASLNNSVRQRIGSEKLSDEERAFVQQCMYPEDDILARRFCTDAAGPDM